MKHRAVNELVKPHVMPGTGDPIVGTFSLPDAEGNYAGILVIAQQVREGTWSTHLLAYRDDRPGDEPRWWAMSGHYDMSLREATADFVARIAVRG